MQQISLYTKKEIPVPLCRHGDLCSSFILCFSTAVFLGTVLSVDASLQTLQHIHAGNGPLIGYADGLF